jgi:hypothetical protein
MELFAPELEGDLLYFDLDTMIRGDLSEIAAVNRLTVLADFYQPTLMASGMMFLPEADRVHAWQEWMRGPGDHMVRHKATGDGGFLRTLWNGPAARWQKILPDQVVSYKEHVRHRGVPEGARVVCFHGSPRPRDIGWQL